MWFWKQALATIAISNVQEIQKNKLLIPKTFVIGWAALLLVVALVAVPIRASHSWGFNVLMSALTQDNGTWRFDGADTLVIRYVHVPTFPLTVSLGFLTAGWAIGRQRRNLLLLLIFSLTCVRCLRCLRILSMRPSVRPRRLCRRLHLVFALRLHKIGMGNAAFLWGPLLIVAAGLLGSIRRERLAITS